MNLLLKSTTVIMGMYCAVNVDKQPMLPMVEGAINKLFHDPADAFYTGRVMNLLFDGVELDCSADDTTVKALCLNFQGEKAFRKIDDGHFAFAVFSGVSVCANEFLHGCCFFRLRGQF